MSVIESFEMQLSTFINGAVRNRAASVKTQTLLIYLKCPNQEYKEEFISRIKQLSSILTKLKPNSGSFPAMSE